MTTKMVIAILTVSGILVVGGGLIGVLSDGAAHDAGMAALMIGAIGVVVSLVGLSFTKAKR